MLLKISPLNLFFITSIVEGQVRQIQNKIPYANETNCADNQFFNIITLQCENCDANSVKSANGFQCECSPGYRTVARFGAKAVQCQQCSGNQVASHDGWGCTSCAQATTGLQRCPNCAGNSILCNEIALNGRRK